VRKVSAGEILIQEGETGLAASELYVVRDGSFEVSFVQRHPQQRSGAVLQHQQSRSSSQHILDTQKGALCAMGSAQC
jgi:CRP-like cAMP-binding protein